MPPRIPIRSFARFAVADRTQQVAIRGRLTAVLLLSPNHIVRNRMVCDAAEEGIALPEHPHHVDFYVLDRRPPRHQPADESCDDILAHYDYYRATKDLEQFGLAAAPGPVLIEYSGVRSKDLVWDLSRLPDADLPRAITVWQRRIAADPAMWRERWRMELVAATVSNTFETLYGRHLSADQLPAALERKPIVGLPPSASGHRRLAQARPTEHSVSRGPTVPNKAQVSAGPQPNGPAYAPHAPRDPRGQTRSSSLSRTETRISQN